MRHTWADEAIFYHIYPLGLLGAPLTNDFVSAPVERLSLLNDWIPRIVDLGCTALYLGPVFESDEHGYDTADYFTVDRRLGTNETLKKLCGELRAAGIKVVFDGVFNHVGRNFWAFRDLRLNGRSSKYADWFCDINFNAISTYGDGFSYAGWYDAYNLVKLNLQNREVREHLFDAVRMWIEDFSIDGIRLDVAEIIDKDFLAELADRCRLVSSECWLMGEIIEGDYNLWANPDILDSATNYEVYKALYASQQQPDYNELSRALERQSGTEGVYRHLRLFTFAENHDTTRLASILRESSLLANVYTILFTMPGIPAIYYGGEFGILGIKGAHDDYCLRPELQLDKKQESHPLYGLIKHLAMLRNTYEAFRDGDYKTLAVQSEYLVFMRRTALQTLIIALNAGPETIALKVDMPGYQGVQFQELLAAAQGFFPVEKECMFISDIPGHGARILLAVGNNRL